jgi:hypothetical protein
VELYSLIKTLQKIEPSKIELFSNIRAIKRYLNDQNFDDFSDKTSVNRLLNHFYLNFFQKYKNLPCNNPSGLSNKRIKIDPLTLRKIYNKFQENGITIKKVEQYTNIHSSNIFHRENTISQISFFKLATYMNKELGYNSIFNLFGQQEIPHEVYIGTHQEISIKKDGNSAELISILLGDGHLSKNNRHVSITLNSIDEERYVIYVKKILNRFFPNCFFNSLKPNSKAISIQSSSKYVHYALIKLGLIAGNKVENQVGCPPWLFQEETTITGSLKGLFDTDGSIVLDKTYNHLILRFTSGSKPLTEGFKQLCNLLYIKTGKINNNYSQPDPSTGKIYRTFWVQISSLNHIKKFFQKIKPEKLLDPYRRMYIGTSMIFETIFPYHIKSNSIHNKIYQDFPNSNDRLFTKNFALYLKSLTEKELIKNKFKTVVGIPFSGKITKQMIDKALILSYTKRKIIFSKDKSNIHQIRNNLKLEICKIISEIIISAKFKLNNLEILNDLDNTLLKTNHPELLLKLENPVTRNLLRNYFSNLINYIQELKKNNRRSTKTPIYKINKIYGLGDREGYQIYRFLKKSFPLVF